MISLHVPLTDKKEAHTQEATNQEVSDIVSNNVSDFPTRHLINAETLALMSPHTMLINSARGPVIDAAALEADIDATNREVVLDVFEHEPQIAESLLAKLAIATPHIAGYTLEGKLRGTQIIYDALCEKLAVMPVLSMHQLLPLNTYLWSELKENPDRLQKFYDIKKDDAALRSKVTHGKVKGADFDQLRRDYHLRREWQA